MERDDPTSQQETTNSIPGPNHTPVHIGPYRILEKLGEGGMGVVYLAEQTEPVRRRVALKVIKLGMDTKQVVVRFESERQALALMDHPAIAKVFDAGTTPEGRPYFAMEYVKGVPITEYCDTRRLGTRERLQLFQRVCEGVQHAHQKAVLHRDLKPSNILVADVDGKPQPRIIDFGVAKATTQKLTEQTMYTAVGQLIGTPEYMSPEQADLTVEDIDTRTDVYSLGVILYQLLSGALPFDSKQLRQAGFEGIIRLLREKDPPRPSTKVSSLGEQTTQIAQRRRTGPRRLAGALKGDLDWIVMRSLEKDRNRRYGSPQELAQDIQRHLNNEPVLAGPPSATYRARKFAKRNRVAVGFATTVVFAVAAGFILLTVQNAKITAARDEAESVVTTLEEMLASVDPTKSGRDVTVKEMLDETAKTLGENFKNQPLTESRLRYTVGKTYFALGEFDAAEGHLLRAVEIRREELGPENIATLMAMGQLYWTYRNQNRFKDAEQLAQEALEINRRVVGEENIRTLRCMMKLGDSYQAQFRWAEAESLLRETLDGCRRALGKEHPLTIGTMLKLGQCLSISSSPDEALTMLREAVELSSRAFGEKGSQTLESMGALATVYTIQRRYEEAEELRREIIEIRRRDLGDEHTWVLSQIDGLARTYRLHGRYAEAESLYRAVAEIRVRVQGKESSRTLAAMNNLGMIYMDRGRYKEAEPILRETLKLMRRVNGNEHGYTLRAMSNLGETCQNLGQLSEAETLRRECLETRRRVLGEDHRETLSAMFHLGDLLLTQGRYDEAELLNRKGLQINQRVHGEAPHGDDYGVPLQTNDFRYNLACSMALQGRRREALSLLQEALDNGYTAQGFSGWKPNLTYLQGDPEFEAIVEELKRRNEEDESAMVE
ncbi:tetratricopeptide repeat protein [Candidatus Eisenbacteria bacterium]|uniref:Tetratricopeptide repeat protein n=1 Tax=Eiseniibacteriota bacterium TaxID=2212470 RepID=A0ABV6YKY9_UNCEI